MIVLVNGEPPGGVTKRMENNGENVVVIQEGFV